MRLGSDVQAKKRFNFVLQSFLTLALISLASTACKTRSGSGLKGGEEENPELRTCTVKRVVTDGNEEPEKVILLCEKGLNYTANLTDKNYSFKSGDQLDCLVDFNDGAGKAQWSCNNGEITFKGVVSKESEDPQPEDIEKPKASKHERNGDNTENGYELGIGGKSNGKENDPECKEYNQDRISCETLQMQNGNSECKYNPPSAWRCVRGCALYLGTCSDFSRCSGINGHGLTCGAFGPNFNNVQCKWGQKWKCKDGCAISVGTCKK